MKSSSAFTASSASACLTSSGVPAVARLRYAPSGARPLTRNRFAPCSMNYALREALQIVYEEGLEARWARHERNHCALVAGVEAMGLEMNVAPPHRLWSLNAVRVPDGVDDAHIRTRLLNDDSIEIGGGLGPLKGKIWRVGLMGSGSSRDNVRLVLDALQRALQAEGFACASGVEAAERVYES